MSFFLNRESNKTRVVNIVQTDLCGMIPQSLVESALPNNLIEFFVDLDNSLKKDYWTRLLRDFLPVSLTLQLFSSYMERSHSATILFFLNIYHVYLMLNQCIKNEGHAWKMWVLKSKINSDPPRVLISVASSNHSTDHS